MDFGLPKIIAWASEIQLEKLILTYTQLKNAVSGSALANGDLFCVRF